MSTLLVFQIKAANALADLSADREVGVKLVDAGALDTLVELCKRDNGLITEYTAVALGNLAAGSKRCANISSCFVFESVILWRSQLMPVALWS